jgi:16S rRNA (guanine966-N2)-methyltransferase
VRIIAGQYKGRRLHKPTWAGLRPTSDKLRETLFNILAPSVAGARVLDAHAGTGAVGLEALSRGAAHVLFVDRDRRAAALIGRNLAQCGVKEGYTIRCNEVEDVLATLESGATFDLIFLDPPYDHPPPIEVLDAAGQRLGQRSVLVLEHATRRPPDVPARLERVREVRSGDSTLTFLARRTDLDVATEQR